MMIFRTFVLMYFTHIMLSTVPLTIVGTQVTYRQ